MSKSTKRALILIDIQNDYFPNGKWPLVGINEAAGNAKLLLETFRKSGETVIHVRHEFTTPDAPFFVANSEGSQTNSIVSPQGNEPVITKNYPNAFRGTNLKQLLESKNIKDIVIVGAMSHVCIDATTRAASDFEYNVTVAHDAVATRALEFNGVQVEAVKVHAAYMAALAFAYAAVISTNEILAST